MSFGEEGERVKESLKRYLDMAAAFSKLSKAELEALFREMNHNGGFGRGRCEGFLEELRARSRRGLDLLTEIIRAEVRKEFDARFSARRGEVADLFERAANIAGEYFGVVRSPDKGARQRGAQSDAPSGQKGVAKKSVVVKSARATASPQAPPPARKSATKVTGTAIAGVKKSTKKPTPVKKATSRAAGVKKTAGAKKTAKSPINDESAEANNG